MEEEKFGHVQRHLSFLANFNKHGGRGIQEGTNGVDLEIFVSYPLSTLGNWELNSSKEAISGREKVMEHDMIQAHVETLGLEASIVANNFCLNNKDGKFLLIPLESS